MKNESSYGKLVAVILFLGLFVGNYFQYQLSPLAPKLMEDFNLSPTQFSSIFSAPMLSAIFLGVVAGVFSDKFGVKKVCTIGLIIMAAGLWLRPFATNYMSLYISMVLSGFGIIFLNINMAKIIGGWFPEDKVGPLMGLTMIGCTLGMTLGTATTAYLPSAKYAFALSAVLETVVLVLWILFMKDGSMTITSMDGENSSSCGANDALSTGGESASNAIKASLKSKNIWLVGLCLMCIMVCNVCLTSFLPTALMSRGISDQSAGLLTAALTIGNLFGSFIGTMMIAKIGRMKPCLLVLSMVVAVCASFAWNLSNIGIILTLGATGFAFGTRYQPL